MHSPRPGHGVQGDRAAPTRTMRLMKRSFNRVVDTIIHVLGSPGALLVAALVIVVWAVTGPIFGFSDTWQLVINTGTTIVTFLMVFVIQNAANRDAKAVHIKLDELITSIEGARNRVVLAETETEEEQDEDIRRLAELAEAAEQSGAPPEAVAGVVEEAAAEEINRPRRAAKSRRR
jgi:low affinity Fe/Cu permease